MNKSWYRPDIDGLRAVAVVAVILFHAKVPGFTGGFVGVDIFFVISGFLITSIIVRQLQAGTFSLTQFWERRIRRIIPVLFVVLLATAIAGYWLILYPLDYLDFGQSLVAQAVFLSNIFFLRKSDYFAGPAEASPLLHTWSLAIEEQFYVLFPILLIVLWKLGRRVVLYVMAALFVASLAWGQWLLIHGEAAFSIPFLPPLWASADNATASFYLLPTRAFELLIGVILALLAIKLFNRSLANCLAGVGVALLLGSIFFFSGATVFPGAAALVPTVGTTLLILAHTGGSTIIRGALSAPPVVWVGLLSYSLYLWHWPALVLGRYYFQTETLDAVQTVGLLGLTLSLSIVTYTFVETPLRGFRRDASRGAVVMAGLGALAVLGGVGYYIMTNNGLPERTPHAPAQLALGATDFGPYWNPCFVHSFELTFDPCRFGPEQGNVQHIVLGDSHGGAALPGLSLAADATDTPVDTYISAGCSPLHPVTFRDPEARCATIYDLALDRIIQDDITDVLLVSRWTNYTDIAKDPEQAKDMFVANVAETLDIFAQTGVQVSVMLQVPHHTYYEPREAFYAAVNAKTLPAFRLPRIDHAAMQKFVNDVWHAEEAAGRVTLFNPTDLLCSRHYCDFIRDDAVLYMDSNHLNATGATYLEPVFTDWLKSS